MVAVPGSIYTAGRIVTSYLIVLERDGSLATILPSIMVINKGLPCGDRIEYAVKKGK